MWVSKEKEEGRGAQNGGRAGEETAGGGPGQRWGARKGSEWVAATEEGDAEGTEQAEA